MATHSSGPPAAVASATHPFSGPTNYCVERTHTLIGNMLHVFPSTAIVHTADHVRSVIKGNYAIRGASVANVDFVFVDVSVGVVNMTTSAP